MIELMISIAVGLVVVSGVIGMFVSTVTSNANNLKMTRLNQELRAAMDIITRDVRRAGYWGGTATGALTTIAAPAVANPFRTITVSTNPAGTANSCIVFTYDYDKDGTPDTAANSDERYGYRVSDSAVEARKDGTNCGDSGWDKLTDESTIEIVPVTLGGVTQPALQFTVTTRVVDVDGMTGAIPCPPTGPHACTGTYTTPSTMTVRDVQIVLSGRLKSDTSVARSLTETVRVSTDLYTP